jgi:hypothetical protein
MAHPTSEVQHVVDRSDPVETLFRLRGLLGLTQKALARILSAGRKWEFTQENVSSMERGHSGFVEFTLQRAASTYFRARGCETDGTGAILFLPPSAPPKDHHAP